MQSFNRRLVPVVCSLSLFLLLPLLLAFMAGCNGSGSNGDTDQPGDQESVDTADNPDTEPLTEEEAEAEVAPLPFPPAGPDAAPDPMLPGPFPVGVKTITLYDESRLDDQGNPRRLKTEIWYPAEQRYKDGPFFSYDIVADSQDENLGDKRTVIENADLPLLETTSVRDAEPDRAHGPYPVILFSHGANGIRWQSLFYTIRLASHGYIVAAVDHEGNTLWDIIRDGYINATVIASAGKRPQDMIFLLDTLLKWNRTRTDFFYHTMDKENVGISGHSFGGFTSVTVPCMDPRVKVSVPHSPVISLSMIYGCVLEEYPVPIMVMGGTQDRTVPYQQQYCDYRLITAPRKYLYELERGGHYTFSEMCRLDLVKLADELDFGDAEDALEDGCSATDNAPYSEAIQTIDYYATAFLNYYLRGSTGSLQYLEDLNDPPFEEVNFYEGEVPMFPEGCEGGPLD